MTIGGAHVTKRTDAADLIARWVRSAASGGIPQFRSERQLGVMGTLGGLQISAKLARAANVKVDLMLHALPARPATVNYVELNDDALSLVRQLEHRIATLPDLAATIDQARQTTAEEAKRASAAIGKPFKHAAALAAAAARAREIEKQMEQQPEAAEPTEQATNEAAAADEAVELTKEAMKDAVHMWVLPVSAAA
ncbi:MAG TPA: hypothetical protein VGM91_00005 [Conexibacter sp.]|jgi:hypothetical protein